MICARACPALVDEVVADAVTIFHDQPPAGNGGDWRQAFGRVVADEAAEARLQEVRVFGAGRASKRYLASTLSAQAMNSAKSAAFGISIEREGPSIQRKRNRQPRSIVWMQTAPAPATFWSYQDISLA